MLGEIDSFDFILAETLGQPLQYIRALPNAEIVEWQAFFHYRNEMEKLHSS